LLRIGFQALDFQGFVAVSGTRSRPPSGYDWGTECRSLPCFLAAVEFVRFPCVFALPKDPQAGVA
jgi:hypothetical protein